MRSVAARSGELVKRGEGRLNLTGAGRIYEVDTVTSQDHSYLSQITAERGFLALPKNLTERHYARIGRISVSNEAVLATCEHASGDNNVAGTYSYYGFFGGGTITNESGKTYWLVRNENNESEFWGRIAPSVRLRVAAGTQLLTGKESTFTATFDWRGKSTIGLALFGRTGEPSSIGTSSPFQFDGVTTVGPGKLVYLGDGETTDKRIDFLAKSDAVTMDAGQTGGVTFAAPWRICDANTFLRFITLAGDNARECTLMCDIVNATSAPAPMTAFLTKTGGGAWRFADTNRVWAGSLWVKEGTLRYDSLEEAGRMCALGLATNLTPSVETDLATAFERPGHAITLGGGETPAVFEYSGTRGFACATRPIRLAGDATLRNGTSARIRLMGVSALGAETCTLTLDGDGANTNEVLDVSDGGGRLSLVKDGDGTWALGGDQTFGGSLAVRKGTLVVRNIADPTYTWFRWTVRDSHLYNGNYGNSGLAVTAFGLFTATDGTGRIGLNAVTHAADYAAIEPGQVAIQDNMPVEYLTEDIDGVARGSTPERMFSSAGKYGMRFEKTWHARVSVKATDRTTWMPFVVRVPDGSGPVVAFDYENLYGKGVNQHRSVKSYVLEGSVDGMHWETLVEDASAPLAGVDFIEDADSTGYYWTYGQNYGEQGGRGASAAPKPIGTGLSSRTYSVLERISSVAVSKGATLVAEGAVELRNLTVDADAEGAGVGTVDGFSFAETGTLDVTGEVSAGGALPLVAVNSATFPTVRNWTLTVNGEASNMRVMTSGGQLALARPGLIVICR